jgi:hypothetical protein
MVFWENGKIVQFADRSLSTRQNEGEGERILKKSKRFYKQKTVWKTIKI